MWFVILGVRHIVYCEFKKNILYFKSLSVRGSTHMRVIVPQEFTPLF